MKKFAVRIGGNIYTVVTEEIVYIEQIGRQLLLNTNERSYCFYGSLDEIEGQLSPNFYRCHSKCMVNMDRISSLEGLKVCFAGNGCCYLGKNSMQRLKRKFIAYLNTL